MNINQIAIDENGHGMESWRKKAVYKKFHTDDMVRQYFEDVNDDFEDGNDDFEDNNDDLSYYMGVL